MRGREIKRIRANPNYSMVCLHNHDQISEFLAKIFLKVFFFGFTKKNCALNHYYLKTDMIKRKWKFSCIPDFIDIHD